jgi:hypothetical protein
VEDIKQCKTPLSEIYAYLIEKQFQFDEEEKKLCDRLPESITEFEANLRAAITEVNKKTVEFRTVVENNLEEFAKETEAEKVKFDASNLNTLDNMDYEKAKVKVEEFEESVKQFRRREEEMKFGMSLFPSEPKQYKGLIYIEKQLVILKEIWSVKKQWNDFWSDARIKQFTSPDILKSLEEGYEKYNGIMNKWTSEAKELPIYESMKKDIVKLFQLIPVLKNLRSEAMEERHWSKLWKELNETFDQTSPEFTIGKISDLNLISRQDFVEKLTYEARRDMNLKKDIDKIDYNWSIIDLTITQHIVAGNKQYRIGDCRRILIQLESDLLILKNLKNNESLAHLRRGSWRRRVA